ncbi:MAG: HEAT repeat domain-containing protein [Planctomycetota bacterium]|jgi:HEAT repeat protein
MRFNVRGTKLAVSALVCLQIAGCYTTPRDIEAYKKKGDVQKLLAVARIPEGSPIYPVRCKAIRALGEIGDPAAVELLIAIMKDKSERRDPRNVAATALGKIGDNRAVEPLITVLKDESEEKRLRTKSAEALGLIGDPRAVEPLTAVLESKTSVRNTPIGAIGALVTCPDEKVVRALIAYTSRSQYFDIERLSDRWAKVDNPPIEPLTTLLKDDDANTRKKAATVLDRLKWKPANDTEKALLFIAKEDWEQCLGLDKSSVRKLLTGRLRDDKDDIRAGAATTLGKTKDPNAVDSLVSVAAEDSSRRVREHARLAILEIADMTRVDLYVDLMDSGGPGVRLKAARILLDSEDPKADEVRDRARKVIEYEESYITEKMLYDARGRSLTAILFNNEGKSVATRTFAYNEQNTRLIDEEVIHVDGEKIHTTDYGPSGVKTNAMWLCLDEKGNIIEKDGKPVLVGTFRAQQESRYENRYSLGLIIERTTKIYPCKNSADETGISDCRYVW